MNRRQVDSAAAHATMPGTILSRVVLSFSLSSLPLLKGTVRWIKAANILAANFTIKFPGLSETRRLTGK